jgi:hypothetical protein
LTELNRNGLQTHRICTRELVEHPSFARSLFKALENSPSPRPSFSSRDIWSRTLWAFRRICSVSAACISCCTSFDRAIWDIIASPAEGKRDNKKTVGFQVRGRVHNDKVMTLESGEALLNSPDR